MNELDIWTVPNGTMATDFRLDKFVGRYLDVLGATGLNIRTIDGYRKRLNNFCHWLGNQGLNVAHEITTSDISGYLDELRDDLGYKPATINAVLTAIRAYLAWLCEEGLLSENVALIIQWQPRDRPVRWLDKNERYRVIRAAKAESDKRNQLIIWTLLLSGMRGDELINLRPDDVLITANAGTFIIGGDHPRNLPIHSQLRQLLAEYLVTERATSDWLFGSQRSEKLTIRGLQYICRSVGDKAHVEGLTPQVLRHTFAHDLVEARVPLFHIADILGAHVKTVLPYPREDDWKSYRRQLDQIRGL